MLVEPNAFATLADSDRGGPDPPYDHFDYVGTRLRARASRSWSSRARCRS